MSNLHQQPVYGPPVPARPVSKAPLVVALIGLLTVIVGVAVGGAVILTQGSAGSVEGDGYAYDLPDGWSDLTGTAGSAGFDSVSGVGDSMLTGSEGLAVGVDDPPAASDADSLRRLAAASMSDLPEATGVESVDDVMIDGDRAVGARASYVGGENEPYGITAYAVVHDGRLFTLSYSSRGAVDEQQVATFDAILDGWRWT